MPFRLLLDQNTERQLASRLRTAGYDIERVVGHPKLGEGAEDAEIAAYASAENRIIVSYDSDFTALESAIHAGVFFVPDQQLSSHAVYSIIEAVASHYGSQESINQVVFLTGEWL